MSGIGFQKLQGQGTTAYDQLQRTSELISEMQKLNYPDIYKQARMFVGENYELTPINRSWRFTSEQTLNFNGRFFGYWTISLEQAGIGASNNSFGRGRLTVFDGDDIQFSSARMVHGDDVLSLNNGVEPNIIGFGSSARFKADGSDSQVVATLSLIGFEIGGALPDPVIVTPPVVIPVPVPPDVNVTIEIKSRPNGTQLFNAVFGTLNISQPNGIVNYNQIATKITLSGFTGLKFDYKYYLDGVLTFQGVNQTSKAIDVYHSHSHKIEIDYTSPVLDAEIFFKHVFDTAKFKLVYDDSTYEDGLLSYKNITKSTATVSLYNTDNKSLNLFKLKAGVLSSLGVLSVIGDPISLSPVTGDKFVACNVNGASVSVANFTASAISFLSGGSVALPSKTIVCKVNTANTAITINNPSGLNINVYCIVNLSVTNYVINAGDSLLLPVFNTDVNGLVVFITN